jgi:hypothetical protein
MKLTDLASKTETSLELLHPTTQEETGVVISGFTPDSKEWRKAAKKINGPAQKQYLTIEKKASKIELDKDSGEKRKKLLIAVVTDITGIDDFKSSPETINELLDNPAYGWMLEQWGEHLDDRSNFS